MPRETLAQEYFYKRYVEPTIPTIQEVKEKRALVPSKEDYESIEEMAVTIHEMPRVITEATGETVKTVKAPFVATAEWAGRVGGWWSDAFHSTTDAFSETGKFFANIAGFFTGWKGMLTLGVVAVVVILFLVLLIGVAY